MKKKLIKILPSRSLAISMALALFDICAVIISYGFALWMRFDFAFDNIPPEYFSAFSDTVILLCAITLLMFSLFRLYKRVWRYASLSELISCLAASALCVIVYALVLLLCGSRMPASFFIIGFIMQFGLSGLIRLSYRLYLMFRRTSAVSPAERTMVIGAGNAGQALIRDIQANRFETERVCCIIDDDKNKIGKYLLGIPVFGDRSSILAAAESFHINKIILAIPSLGFEDRREILNICSETSCGLWQISPKYARIGKADISSVSSVDLEDLLGRKPIEINQQEVFETISGKVVLVTGGGGSIGSELCRQIASHAPRRLIIFEIYENNAFAIQMELKKRFPELDLVTLIGSVRDSKRIDSVFEKYRPDIVYHAAAHKHVPLMEDSPCEAIKNNVLGTYKTAHAAIRYGTKRFVLVSTDKAVNPTNIMGASKRLCEMVVQTFDALVKTGRTDIIPSLSEHGDVYSANEKACTEFVAVRFGNVLGSNGSVVPIFKRQIAEGGPVTVTHPDIIRYFMTIPEAVSLILQAGAYARGGEIYVFDMGEPIKIDTLARNMITLAGLRPDIDIKIEYTGLRPGEKLYEEKLMSEEGLEKTANDMIFVGHPMNFDPEELIENIEELKSAAYENDETIRALVESMVPTYFPEKAGASAIKNKEDLTLTR